jgi:hypothetical protein
MAKITVGFKCEPELKYDLLLEAEGSGITLSEYVENICANRGNASQSSGQDSDEMAQLHDQVMDYESRLNHYETVVLGPLLMHYRGKSFDIRLPDGSVVSKEVNQPIDLLEIIVKSLKIP